MPKFKSNKARAEKQMNPQKNAKGPIKRRRKAVKKVVEAEDVHLPAEFQTDFNFDASDGEEGRSRADEDADLDGLRVFLQRNGSQQLCEKNEEASDDDAMAFGVPVTASGELVLPDKKDKLRFKQGVEKEAVKNNPEGDFFDSNSRKIVQAASDKPSKFDDFKLSKPILKAIFECGFQTPTPIQTACIPVALAGRDICACSATGTGKTAAFMLPILERLIFKPRGQKAMTKVLVLVPTRELAIQVFQVSRRLAKHSSVEVCLVAGGLDMKAQEGALRQGLDIVVATPGRLIDHLHNSAHFTLSQIEVLVIDEADRILEDQFSEQLNEIIKLCASNRQTMLFSATMTEEVENLANFSLVKPVKLFINENTDMALGLHQEFIRIRVRQANREEEERKREALVAALVTRSFPDHAIIFLRTKRDCQRMQHLLELLGAKVGQLHGALNQVQRVEMLFAFKRQKNVRVLCATDLAARGLDIEGISTVINMNMPGNLKQYIHRVGRTARAGRAGRSISLVGEEDRKLMKEILKMTRKGELPPPIQRTVAPEVVDMFLTKIRGLKARQLGP